MIDTRNSLAWRRFRRNRAACLGLVVMVGLLLMSALAFPFSSRWSNVQDLQGAVRAAPTLRVVTPYDAYERALPDSLLGAGMHRVAGLAGYDDLGRSLLFRLCLGWLVSLGVGLGAAVMAVVIGVSWGATAAMAGGRVDAAMMRIVDILYGLPYVLFVILLKVVLEPPLRTVLHGQGHLANVIIVFVAIGAVSWLTMARVIRGQVLSLRSRPFVEAAYASGVGRMRVMWRHLLPNLVGPIAVYATLVIPQAILQESFLSFLGIGVVPPTPSLGLLATDGVQAVNSFVGFWWLIAFPCGILVLTLLALNFIGDGLRDALDPRTDAVAIF